MQTRSRIVCTLGPASDSDEIVRSLICAGMDVARLNFSHGDHSKQAARIERVERLAQAEGVVVAILADLQGPKIRIGDLAGGALRLTPGGLLTLVNGDADGTDNRVQLGLPELGEVARVGDRVLLSDGAIELVVAETGKDHLVTRVVVGGELKPRQGVSLPNAHLKLPSLTDKDRADVEFAVAHGADYIALSFVRRAEDIAELKRLLAGLGSQIPVIAKIEKPEAIEHIDAILAISDGIMVARGDLGVEAPAERVPLYQKMMIRKASNLGKPVITATQMLESMITNPRPTRAEASDVANAVLDGTDAVMLSAETAIGRYPVEAVQMMERIVTVAEQEIPAQGVMPHLDRNADDTTDAVATAACQVATQLNARIILTLTTSGQTARLIARHRPHIPIFAATASETTRRQLALVWGVQSAIVPPLPDVESMVKAGIAAALSRGLVEKGDLVVATGGVPVGLAGRTNTIQVWTAGESGQEGLER